MYLYYSRYLFTCLVAETVHHLYLNTDLIFIARWVLSSSIGRKIMQSNLEEYNRVRRDIDTITTSQNCKNLTSEECSFNYNMVQ